MTVEEQAQNIISKLTGAFHLRDDVETLEQTRKVTNELKEMANHNVTQLVLTSIIFEKIINRCGYLLEGAK